MKTDESMTLTQVRREQRGHEEKTQGNEDKKALIRGEKGWRTKLRSTDSTPSG